MKKAISTKRSLLLCALSLLLCVSMLVGSTFAWFTDEVTSVGNKISAGTLDISLYQIDGGVETEITNASAPIFSESILWEPGYEAVVNLKLVNNGTLALKWRAIPRSTETKGELADVIDVYLLKSGEIIDTANGRDYYTGNMVKVGTLSEVLTGTAVISGEMTETGATASFSLLLKMQETAGNEYQNKTAGAFDISVVATQLTYESDSFDNQYDKGSSTVVDYDSTKTVAENASALQAALDSAEEGDVIVIGPGNWYATKYQQFTINTDNVTIIGDGAVLGFEDVNTNSIFDVYGDNVTIKNIVFNENKNEYNQCLLAIGAENLTVDGCTFYGENLDGGNTPTLGIYIFENLDILSDEANDEVTKYTIINNKFLGAAVGTYKGAAQANPNDPGAVEAQVSEDMLIANNTFENSNILIENWRSWSKEAVRDHEFVPTIVDNTFVSPNLCFANTPHSIYVRCYRQGDPNVILPANYFDEFVANNTVATPANDTVVEYSGKEYKLSDTYGAFYRENATYGNIAYCYGQTFVEV